MSLSRYWMGLRSLFRDLKKTARGLLRFVLGGLIIVLCFGGFSPNVLGQTQSTVQPKSSLKTSVQASLKTGTKAGVQVTAIPRNKGMQNTTNPNQPTVNQKSQPFQEQSNTSQDVNYQNSQSDFNKTSTTDVKQMEPIGSLGGKLAEAVTHYFSWFFSSIFMYAYDAFSNKWLLGGAPVFSIPAARSMWNFFLGIGLVVFLLSMIWLGFEVFARSESVEKSRERVRVLVTLVVMMLFSAFAIDFASAVIGQVTHDVVTNLQFQDYRTEATPFQILSSDSEYSTLLDYGYAPSQTIKQQLNKKINETNNTTDWKTCLSDVGVSGLLSLGVKQIGAKAGIFLASKLALSVIPAGWFANAYSVIAIGHAVLTSCIKDPNTQDTYQEAFVRGKEIEYGIGGLPFLIILLLSLTVEGVVIFVSSIIIGLIAAFSPVWFTVAFVRRDYMPVYAWVATFFRFKITVLVIVILQMFMLRFLKDAIPLVESSFAAQIVVEVVITLVFAYFLTSMMWNSIKYSMFDILNLGGVRMLGFGAKLAKRFGHHFDFEAAKNVGEHLDKYAKHAKELAEKGRQRSKEEESLIEEYSKKIQAAARGEKYDSNINDQIQSLVSSRLRESNPISNFELSSFLHTPEKHIQEYAATITSSGDSTHTTIEISRNGGFGSNDILEVANEIRMKVSDPNTREYQAILDMFWNTVQTSFDQEYSKMQKERSEMEQKLKTSNNQVKNIDTFVSNIKKMRTVVEDPVERAKLDEVIAQKQAEKEEIMVTYKQDVKKYVNLLHKQNELLARHSPLNGGDLEKKQKFALESMERLMAEMQITQTAHGVEIKIPHFHFEGNFIDVAEKIKSYIVSQAPKMTKREILVYKHGDRYVTVDENGRTLYLDTLPDNARVIGRYNVYKAKSFVDEFLSEKQTTRGQENKEDQPSKRSKKVR